MTFATRPRRDVERNHEAILNAAIAVLANTAQATMADIARASGTGRSTLYRHFPDREALIDAIYERVLGEAVAICEQSLLTATADGDPIGTLIEITLALASLGDEYRYLEVHRAQISVQYPESAQRLGAILHQLIAAGQQDGRIRRDLDEDWLTAMLGAIITQATRRLSAEARRADAVRATVTSLLAPTP